MNFVGQGFDGSNVGVPGGTDVQGHNEEGLDNLLILEIPFEFNFKITKTPLEHCRHDYLGILPIIFKVAGGQAPLIIPILWPFQV